jgi:hypothetical protein
MADPIIDPDPSAAGGKTHEGLSKWLRPKESPIIKQTSAAAVMARFLVFCAATARERPIPAVVVPPTMGR